MLVYNFKGYNFLGSLAEDVIRQDCGVDEECDDDFICKEDKCIDPCKENVFYCGLKATCLTENHKRVCQCPKGWYGDPNEECFKR